MNMKFQHESDSLGDMMESEKDEITAQDLTNKLSSIDFQTNLHTFFHHNRIHLKPKNSENAKIDESVEVFEEIRKSKKLLENTTKATCHTSQNMSFFKMANLYGLVNKFVRNLKKMKQEKLQMINLIPIHILGDSTYFIEKTTPKMACVILNLFSRLWQFIKTDEMHLFELLVMAILILNLIIVPINEAYALQIGSHFLGFQFLIFSESLFVLNLLKNCVPNLNLSNQKRPKKYCEFLRDFIPCLYFILRIFFSNSGVMFFFLPTIRMLKLNLDKVEYFFCQKQSQKFLFSLSKFVLYVFIILHFFACITIYVALKQNEYGIGWIAMQSLTLEKNFASIYLIALNNVIFSVFFLKDPLSSTDLEKICNIIFFGVSFVLFTWNFKSILSYLQEFNQSDENMRKQKECLNIYLAENKVDYALKLKTDECLDEISTRSDEKEIQNSLKLLYWELKLELFENKFGKISKKIPFLSFFSTEFLAKFFTEIEEKIYLNKCHIFENSSSDPCLYMIESGKIEVGLSRPGRDPLIIMEITQGECFGDFSLFSMDPFKYFIQSGSDRTKLKIMKQSTFIKLVSENPSDYEKFCFLRDRLVFNKDFSQFLQNCKFCGGSNHAPLDCLQNFLFNNKQQAIKAHLASYPNFRSILKRPKRQKFNALILNQKIVSKLRSRSLISSGGSLMTDHTDEIDEPIIANLTENSASKDEKKEDIANNVELSIKPFENTSLEMILITKGRHKEKKSSTLPLQEETKEDLVVEIDKGCRTDTEKTKTKNFDSIGFSAIIEEKQFEFDAIGEFRFYFRHNNFSNLKKNIWGKRREEQKYKCKNSGRGGDKIKKNKFDVIKTVANQICSFLGNWMKKGKKKKDDYVSNFRK